jgi:hypothetical protein
MLRLPLRARLLERVVLHYMSARAATIMAWTSL